MGFKTRKMLGMLPADSRSFWDQGGFRFWMKAPDFLRQWELPEIGGWEVDCAAGTFRYCPGSQWVWVKMSLRDALRGPIGYHVKTLLEAMRAHGLSFASYDPLRTGEPLGGGEVSVPFVTKLGKLT